MSLPQRKKPHLPDLFRPSSDEVLQRDKAQVEALRSHLQQMLQNDPTKVKKAALIIEHWLQQPKKK
jgi:hypothetical protein